jgi:hypothetical protein
VLVNAEDGHEMQAKLKRWVLFIVFQMLWGGITIYGGWLDSTMGEGATLISGLNRPHVWVT